MHEHDLPYAAVRVRPVMCWLKDLPHSSSRRRKEVMLSPPITSTAK
jgi:hypothetical protein